MAKQGQVGRQTTVLSYKPESLQVGLGESLHLRTVLSWLGVFNCCGRNHEPKKLRNKERFIILLTHSYHSLPLKKVRAGAKDRS